MLHWTHILATTEQLVLGFFEEMTKEVELGPQPVSPDSLLHAVIG